MKYKQLAEQQQREIEYRKLSYDLLKIAHKKEVEGFIGKQHEQVPVQQSEEPISKVNKRTEIYFRSFYTNRETFEKGLKIASAFAQAGIFDKINVDIPMDWISI